MNENEEMISRRERTLESLLRLGTFLLLVFMASSVGGFFTARSLGDWYQNLNKPAFNPPDWIFSPVWISLYIMIAVSAWLVWRKSGFSGARWAMIAFLAQLVLNSGWSVLFFGLHLLGAAFLEIVVLWIVILMCIILYWRHSLLAALLMVPYLLWVAFAAVLNLAFWRINS